MYRFKIYWLDEKLISYRSFFKKWLDIEHRLGDDEGAALVKQKAIEWTQKAVTS